MKSACPATTSENCLYLNIWVPSRALGNKLEGQRLPVQSKISTSSSTSLNPAMPAAPSTPKKSKKASHNFESAYIPLDLVQTESPSTAVYPVYVFIHGGMFTLGHAGSGLMNGSAIASSGVVVVTFNYRLGALGFLSYNDIAGNFGFQDQLFALQWVQSHIHAFSGNAHEVTLGGQSAGANSVALHMTTPDSEGLFHQVILESPLLGLPLFTQQQASYELGSEFAYRLGCTNAETAVECLRNASTADILAAQSGSGLQISTVRKLFGSPYFSSLILPWAPVVGNIIQDQPLNLIRSGQCRRMPAIAGFTKDEFASFTPSLVPELGRYSYSALVYAYFGLHVSSRVLDTYPASDELPDQRRVVSDVTRDMFVACPLRTITVNNTFPAYLYRFDHVYSDSRLWAEYSQYCADYACHSSEVAAVFLGKKAADLTEGHLTPDEAMGADLLHRYFVRFIRTGDPNGHNDFPWAKSVGSGPYLQMDLPLSLTPEGVEGSKCDMWDDIGYFW
jgi:carboxylesterase type B